MGPAGPGPVITAESMAPIHAQQHAYKLQVVIIVLNCVLFRTLF